MLDALRRLGLAPGRAPLCRPGPTRRKPRGGAAAPLPVEPDRPNNLTGGAAAALEFDD